MSSYKTMKINDDILSYRKFKYEIKKSFNDKFSDECFSNNRRVKIRNGLLYIEDVYEEYQEYGDDYVYIGNNVMSTDCYYLKDIWREVARDYMIDREIYNLDIRDFDEWTSKMGRLKVIKNIKSKWYNYSSY